MSEPIPIESFESWGSTQINYYAHMYMRITVAVLSSAASRMNQV